MSVQRILSLLRPVSRLQNWVCCTRLIVVMDHSLGPSEGFINPLIYKFGQEQYSGTFSGAPALYFISNGSNGAFSANNGYSLAVGWGSINAYNFVQA